jgi:hypothetical protein
MMSVIGAVGLAIAVILLGLQVFWACRFALSFRPRAVPLVEEPLPLAAVILCVRGADPSLAACVKGLVRQDYPSFQVFIVLDSAGDPAVAMLHDVLGKNPPPNVKMLVLESPQSTCSLKVSALMQAVGELEESIQAIALIDADVVPHRHWLRELMQPFADPSIGASTGFRWHVPNGRTNWWTLVRCVWNAVACTQMAALKIPWGGSMALRASLCRSADMLSCWSRSFGEDTSCHRVLRSQGYRLACVPALTMVNRESIGSKGCFTFIRRQLVSARLGHENWPTVLAIGLGTPAAVLATAVCAAAALTNGEWELALGLASALAIYSFAMALCLGGADRQINRLLQARGEPRYPFTGRSLVTAPFTAAFYVACLISAAFVRRVEWRGITYVVEGANYLRMVHYRPIQSAVNESEPSSRKPSKRGGVRV